VFQFRTMKKKDFVLFSLMFSSHEQDRTKIEAIWRDVFNFEDDTIADVAKIESLSLDQLKKYCRSIEAPHGVVTNGSETVFVRPGELLKEREDRRSEHEEQYEGEEGSEEGQYDELEREGIVSRISHYDNMVQHLSPEERVEYLRERQAEKEKFGANYVDGSFDLSKIPESQRILFELSWQLEDIPDEYQLSILKGKIPPDFKEVFLEALPDSLLERYGEYFSRGRIPKVMVKAIMTSVEQRATKRNKLKAKENEIEEEGEQKEEENEEEEKTLNDKKIEL